MGLRSQEYWIAIQMVGGGVEGEQMIIGRNHVDVLRNIGDVREKSECCLNKKLFVPGSR